MFPADPIGIGMMLEPMGLAAGPVVPTREWRELYAALKGDVVAAIHPFYTASVREFEAAGRPIVGSRRPWAWTGPLDWIDAIAKAANVDAASAGSGQATRVAGDPGGTVGARRSAGASPCRVTKAPS